MPMSQPASAENPSARRCLNASRTAARLAVLSATTKARKARHQIARWQTMRSADTSAINFQYNGTKPQLRKATSPTRTPEVVRDETGADTLGRPPSTTADANHCTKSAGDQPPR